jgi:drug/metabolite transporter (DMT)-like permease
MAELSFAVPATAAILVLETICARVLLIETISWKRWVGVSFIVCEIGFLSRSSVVGATYESLAGVSAIENGG